MDVPAIEEFDLTSADGGATGAMITGQISKRSPSAGWTPDQGTRVAGLPQPSAGVEKAGAGIKLAAPPAPDAVLYVWLRGETKPRVTTVHAN